MDSDEPVTDDFLRYAAEMLRADSAPIATVGIDADIERWEDLVDDVIYSLRRAGWTVERPIPKPSE
jgi:hypothetical protein